MFMYSMDKEVVKTIRLLAADAVEKANSGHPGLPMGAAPMAFVLWKSFLRGSATDPRWADRDRFVLSAGHGSALIYILLHLFGYEVSMDDLKKFRQLGSLTPGHPEFGITPGVETTTGPLGQGFANAVGMAISELRLAETFNTREFNLVDHYTYVLAGDGDLMEGISSEAASLAGHLKLGKLIVLYDDNNITIDGGTELTFTEDVLKRFEAYGWHVQKVEDGNDMSAIHEAIHDAKLDTSHPSLIAVKTIIGYGSPNKAGKSAAHGAPLGPDELIRTKELMDADPETYFDIPDEIYEYMKEIIDRREIDRFMWEEKVEAYIQAYPEKAEQWKQWFDYELVHDNFDAEGFCNRFDKSDATRSIGGEVLNALMDLAPNLMGGSADLNSSTKTYLKGKGDFSRSDRNGANISFGVREHAMAGILNGMALHGGLRPFGSTFLVFADYMKPSIRLSALMGLPVVYVFTHDSIAVGEDGPTHQPIEHLLLLRSIPNLFVYRPGDGLETAASWIEILKRVEGPSALILTRQKLGTLGKRDVQVDRGAYVILSEEGEMPEFILIATGSEVELAVKAAIKLKAMGRDPRVVSMPCVEQFLEQNPAYIESVLPGAVKKRISVEMGRTLGWERFVGLNGLTIGIDRFGESGPGEAVMAHFGFTPDKIADRVLAYLAKTF
jgi:transketolase